ncbi:MULTISPECIES: DUF2788 domain-containing protein [Motilimonas]|uniref:DUF2788 domain-containing protein n=1 Tax=Motilimonas cestriensis TaxID=2742685 RepID=A0ABS8W3G3_9GAMM|nr:MULTISPECIES: DUF2788 domain-containing protein [Motilimonas]MCE0556735.1 DUF2788 domain-containing protein [Motilimonas sp. E26]MCE2593469.1 DUF2788 domain-containing protein [Motilimonas cestriensis]MDO6526782.1 DUF2788 domain-containing protein [Motilimonas sp. 1_MG-2023]
MLSEYVEEIETLGLYGFYIMIFLLIGLSINDVLKRSNVPKFGRTIVWMVLFLGCAGFVSKGIIEVFWESNGLG